MALLCASPEVSLGVALEIHTPCPRLRPWGTGLHSCLTLSLPHNTPLQGPTYPLFTPRTAIGRRVGACFYYLAVVNDAAVDLNVQAFV